MSYAEQIWAEKKADKYFILELNREVKRSGAFKIADDEWDEITVVVDGVSYQLDVNRSEGRLLVFPVFMGTTYSNVEPIDVTNTYNFIEFLKETSNE